MKSSTQPKPIVFTAQSKREFYCRDAICEFVFNKGGIPLNPFRVFEYFLNDRVDRNLIREGNNNLIRISDELWVFGVNIADGVFFEMLYAKELGKNLRFFTVANKADGISEVGPESLKPEPELSRKGYNKDKMFRELIDHSPAGDGQLHLFNINLSWNEDAK